MSGEWIELESSGPASRLDEAAALLIAAGSPGVEESPAGLKAYLPRSHAGRVALLGKGLSRIGYGLECRDYDDRDWSERWKRHIRAHRAGVFLVRPPWSRARARRGEREVIIEPGMAFGTGSHNTTRLCLRALSGLRLKGLRVLDVGTGSGVLAIAAAKHGAASVTGTDIDPVALDVARANARKNRVRVTIPPSAQGLVRGRFHVVLANILSSTLITLRDVLAARLAPGGTIVVSGILKEECQGVRRAYVDAGLKPVRTLASGEWRALVMQRPARRQDGKQGKDDEKIFR